MIRTWLPIGDFAESAMVLHDEELYQSKQHAVHILGVLSGKFPHLRHNPTVTMWRGYEYALVAYGTAVCQEWVNRGREDKVAEVILSYGTAGLESGIWTPEKNGGMPHWFGIEGFHESQRSGLLQRRPDYYRALWPTVSDKLPMVTPGQRPS